jgi:hypothetical protein
MEDVLEVYQRPYDPRYPVVCVDETGKELRTTPRGELALQPGLTRSQDSPAAKTMNMVAMALATYFWPSNPCSAFEKCK